MKREIEFKDAKGNIAKVEVEISNGRFSMTGDYCNGCGQIVDEIKPKNDAQKRLIALWRRWHLNDMKAGTPKQEEAVTKWLMNGNKYDYNNVCDYLNSLDSNGNPLTVTEYNKLLKEMRKYLDKIKELENKINTINSYKDGYLNKNGWLVIPEYNIKEFADSDIRWYNLIKKLVEKANNEINNVKKKIKKLQLKTLLYDKLDNGEIYKYGSKWLKEELPEDIENQVNACFDAIEMIEDEERNGKLVSELTKKEIETYQYENELIALAKNLELTIDELDEITSLGNNEYEYGGIRYFVGTYEEGEEKARSYLENDDYLWKDAVQNGETMLGLNEWIDEVINMDGVGSILNTWDGSEDYEEVNGTNYMICRM